MKNNTENKTYKYNFNNPVYVHSDELRKDESFRRIGSRSYDSDGKSRIYSLKTMWDAYNNGETDSLIVKSNGELVEKTNLLVGIGGFFKIICKYPVGKTDGYEDILNYAYEQKWIYKNPQPLKMKCGTKTLKVNEDGTFDIHYLVNTNLGVTKSYLKKIILGAMYRLKNDYIYINTDDRAIYCNEIVYEDNLSNWTIYGDAFINIKGLDAKSAWSVSNELKAIDLELYIISTLDFDKFDLINAIQMYCSDSGNEQWLKYRNHKDEDKNESWYSLNSNIAWYEREFGKD